MDQCETLADELMPASKQYNHIGLFGDFKATVIYLAESIGCWMGFSHLHAIRKTKQNMQTNSRTVFLNGSN